MKGTPWDFESNAGEGTEDGTIPERTDERASDPLVELPPRVRARRMHAHIAEVERYGPTRGSPVRRGSADQSVVHRGNTQRRTLGMKGETGDARS